MNISYNWLKDYLDFDLQPDEVAAALTSIGLETGGVEEVQTIKGGLEGLVIGEVLTCEEHPNSDHLHITTVNVGGAEPLQIVCGAPNVAAGQKVVVAVNGTKLYDGDECFTIKRSKIRGVESNGMICAEDEIGIGTDHAGIIVLPADAVVGTPAKEYYNVKSDYVLEVDITPNRVDATSHFGVARDLAAYLKQNGKPANLKRPSVDAFKIDDEVPAIEVVVENKEACLRYSGITIKNVTVKESPEWLQNRLKVIGLRPINNVVDITNYILHGVGPVSYTHLDYILIRRLLLYRALCCGYLPILLRYASGSRCSSPKAWSSRRHSDRQLQFSGSFYSVEVCYSCSSAAPYSYAPFRVLVPHVRGFPPRCMGFEHKEPARPDRTCLIQNDLSAGGVGRHPDHFRISFPPSKL